MRFSMEENRGLKSKLKALLLPSGRSPRHIRLGLLAGLTMQLDLAHQSQRWLGLQEREIFDWFRRLGNNVRTAVDVGANDGSYTLYFLAGTSADRIFSFEPSPDCVRELQENLALNNLEGDERLRLIPKKVGAETGGECATLDSFVSSLSLPCLIKVDIDGGELDLLKGASECLHLRAMRWIIEVHSKSLQQDCLQTLRRAGYHVVIVHNAWWRHLVPELRPGELNHWLVAFRDNEKDGGCG